MDKTKKVCGRYKDDDGKEGGMCISDLVSSGYRSCKYTRR